MPPTYVRRGRRYGLLSEGAAELALKFVENLDGGYHLDFRSIGVVFEQAAAGSHVDEDEPGFEVHRFGADLARVLFDAATKGCRPAEQEGSAATDKQASHQPGPARQDHAAAPFDSIRSALGGVTTLPGQGTDKSQSVAEGGRMAGADHPPSTGVVEDVPAEDQPTGDPPESSGPAPVTSDLPPEPTPAALPPTSGLVPATPAPDALLGANEPTPQFGFLGKSGDAKVALDLTGCNTISLFGVQGFGKSYTLGVIAEMATEPVGGINVLPAPLATVLFHYHKSDAYAPEFATATGPNRKPREVEALAQAYGAAPHGLRDVLILTPEAKVEQRQREFPHVTVQPIQFSSAELGAESWKFLLGAFGNDSLYVRQLVAIMRKHRHGLTLQKFEDEIRDAELTGAVRRLAEDRINLARPYINDSASLGGILRPGRTVIVDLRDEWIEKEEALGLFVVMLRIFASAKFKGRDFNKLVVFDEAHKYITESELIGQVVETIREMRHQATSVVIASQDPLSVPRAVVELTSVLVLHRMTSPQWLKHLKGAIVALEGIGESVLASLQPGEALVWAQRSTDKRFTQRPQKLVVRPRFTQHGGGTKTAIEGETVR